MTAAAIFLCCSVSVYAAQSEYANADKLYSRNGDESIYISEDNFLYNFKGEQPGVSICGYVGESTDITIPHIINGREVSAIYKDSFAGNETLESVSFPNSIKEIGANCFNGCTKLTTVKLATGVNQFEDVFCDCPALESMVFPQGVHSIQDSFKNCTSLSYVKFARSVSTIGDHSFSGCTSLRKIDWLGGIIKLGNAFDDCPAIESVAIPEGVVLIDGAFDNCDSLKKITFPETLLYITGGFTNCSSLTEVALPQKLLFVNEAFNNCESLSKLKYCESTTISETAFIKCPKLVVETKYDSLLHILGWCAMIIIMAIAGYLTFRLLTFMAGNILRKKQQEQEQLI